MAVELFETHSPARLLARFAWPSIVSLVAGSLYTVVDRVFVGQFVGTEALSATTVVFPLAIAVFAVAAAIGGGTSTLVSLALGKKDSDEAEAALGQAALLSVAASLGAAALMIPLTEPLLVWLSTPPAIVGPARDFFLTTLWGLPFLTLSVGLGNAIRSQGRAKTSMVTGLVGVVVNILLCILFVGVWGWGLIGSAWATVVAQGFAALVTVGFYFTPLTHLRLRRRFLAPRPRVLGRILSLGLPSFLFEAIFVVVMFVLNARVQAFGAEQALAAVGIINTLSALFFMPVFGLIQGALPMFGYYQGAGRAPVNRRVFWGVLGVSTLFLSACTVVIEGFPLVLLGLFTSDTALRQFCVVPLQVFLALTPLAALPMLAGSYFQAVGRPGPALAVSMIRPILLVVFVLLLPEFWGFDGFLAAGPLSDAGGIAMAAALILADPALRPRRPSVDSQPESGT